MYNASSIVGGVVFFFNERTLERTLNSIHRLSLLFSSSFLFFLSFLFIIINYYFIYRNIYTALMIDKRKKVKWNDRVKGSSWVKLFNRSEAFSRERRIHVFRLTIRYVYISIYIYTLVRLSFS